MKSTLLFFLLLVNATTFAQHGGVQIQLRDQHSRCYYDNVRLIASRDTVILDTVATDAFGNILILQLPVGDVSFLVQENGRDIARFTLPVQLYQLLSTEVLIDNDQQAMAFKAGSQVTFVPGMEAVPQTPVDEEMQYEQIHAYRYNDIEEVAIQSVLIRDYSLLSSSSFSSCRISTHSANDRMVINSQTDLLESRVGGVTHTIDGLQMRGGRTDAGYYYIDGVKVRGNAAIPHSSIQQLTVYTGGLPANFGDATGGIVSIETKSCQSIRVEREQRAGNYVQRDYYEPKLRPGVALQQQAEQEFISNRDAFLPIYENLFLSPLDAPHSTFGIDVDRASWSFVKTQLAAGNKIPRDAVKLEEMINSFDYSLPEVPAGKPMNLSFERMSCPWNPAHELVTVNLRAMDLPVTKQRPPHNLVFLVDVSGSMTSENKLPLLREGLVSFVKTLLPTDRVSLVTYAGSSGVALQPTLCSEQETIIAAIQQLGAGGSTNGIGGIKTAYELALTSFLPGGNNRIILATDGDFNVGISSPRELEDYISLQRGKGIYLTALGFGMGNYRNDVLETLADRGDGNHFYIGSLQECKEVLEVRLGNLINLARDVKLNVEFNPKLVAGYRLIGYENRLMPSKDFRDDTKDGGEIGYGHVVTAVYEIEPGKAEEALDAAFSKIKPTGSGRDLCKVSLRYKLLDAAVSTEESSLLSADSEVTEHPLLQTIIAFGLELRQSAYKGTCSPELLRTLVVQLGATEQERILKTAIESYLGY